MLKFYYFVGGMPESVFHFYENRDFHEVRNVQHRILDAYEQDLSSPESPEAEAGRSSAPARYTQTRYRDGLPPF